MSVGVARAAPPTRGASLRALGGIEARRYVRHPLFLIGSPLLGVVTIVANDLDAEAGYGTVLPAFFLGVLGVFIGHQLARSMAGSTDAVEAAPSEGTVRTAALCLACLVPGAVALVWVMWVYVATTIWPIPAVAASAGRIGPPWSSPEWCAPSGVHCSASWSGGGRTCPAPVCSPRSPLSAGPCSVRSP